MVLPAPLIKSTCSIETALTSAGAKNEDPLITSDVDTTCVICLEVMDEEQGNLFTVPSCKHSFHCKCIAEWKKQSRLCPCCRGLLPEEIGPTWSRLQKLPPEDVYPEITRCEMLENLIFWAVWIAYPLCLVSTAISVEVVSIGLAIMPFFFFVVYDFFRTKEYLYACCLVIIVCFLFPLAIAFLITAVIVQILYMLYRTLKFYALVSLCRIRWNYGASFIIGRTIILANYWFDCLL